jgi:imidazolonepropionase-like amidohydrolase
MKKIALFFSIFICTSSCNNYDSSKYELIIQNVKLFDGDSVIPSATVLVQENKVKEIIIDRTTEFEGNNVIDGRGKTIIPGLINAHVHAWRKEHSKESVKAGVLTMLDLLNGDLAAIDTLRKSGDTSRYFAYYYSSGFTVTVPKGHTTQFGPVPTISDAMDVPKFINERVQEGSDYIKLIIESGNESNPWPTLNDNMIKLAIEKSREYGKISVAHISRRSDAIRAAKYGINGLAHIWRRDTTGITNEEVKILKDNKVFIIPTLIVRHRAPEKWGPIDMDLIRKDILKLHQAGIPLLAGTDSPNLEINYGSDLYKELQLLVRSGLTPLEALKSATSVTSKSFKLGQKGLIKEGYSADFILISGDPTIDIMVLSNIEAIWKQGERITPTNKR